MTSNIGVTLKSGLGGRPRSLKIVPFESLGTRDGFLFHMHSIATLAVSEIFSVKLWHDLKRIGVTQGHWK